MERPANRFGYENAHNKVRAKRGRASEHICSCGAPAVHWAYDHADPEEMADERGRRYSPKPEHYQAMCANCHLRFDTDPEFHRIKELVLSRPCPRCGAPPNEYCITPSGLTYKSTRHSHVSRKAGLDVNGLYRALYERLRGLPQ